MKWMRLHSTVALLGAGLLVILVFGLSARPADQGRQQPGDPIRPLSPSGPIISTAPPVDCAAIPCMALTFDDGPDPKTTPRILETLAAKQTKATFFVTGVHASAYQDIIRRIHQQGHEIGNHSWNHANLTTLSPAQIDEQVFGTQTAVMNADVPAPRWFRPPYGAMNDQVRAHVPLGLVLWNVDPQDWSKKDTAGIIEHIKTHAGPGRIVDLHDVNPLTVDALPGIIDNLRPHYQLVTISQLLDAVPGQRGEFYGR